MSRATRFAASLALLLGGAWATATWAAPDAPELEPYRALARRRGAVDSVLTTVRAALLAAVEGADVPAPRAPEWPGSVRPLYVTLVRGRATRACVGSDGPSGSLAESLAHLGDELATHDRRHPPLGEGELDTLRLVVAFAGDPHAVADPLTVDPVHEGLKIETDRGAVAFLPGEARTVAWALGEARRIGVLAGRASDARYSRFSVVVMQGPAHARTAPLSGEPR